VQNLEEKKDTQMGQSVPGGADKSKFSCVKQEKRLQMEKREEAQRHRSKIEHFGGSIRKFI